MKIFKKLLILVLIILSGVYYYFNYDYIFKNPAEKIELNSVVKSTLDKDGNVYIIGESGSSIIKIDKKDQIIFSFNVEKEYGTAKKILVVNNNIYVQTTSTEEAGYRVAGDKIIVLSTDGLYKKTIYDNKYEEPKLVTEICGFYEVDNKFTYVVSSEEGFELRNSKNEVIEEYSLENASNIVNSFAVSSDGSEIYYCTLSGLVCKYVDGKKDKVIFDAAETGEFSIPRCVTMDDDGNIYFTDIGRREVYTISENGEAVVVPEYEDGVDVSEKDICYYIDANNGLISNSEYAAKIYGDDELRYVYKLSYSVRNKIICSFAWIVVLGDIAIMLLILVKLVLLIKTKMTKFGKMALAAVAIVGIIALIFMGIILPPFKSLLLNQMFNQAQVLSESATNVIDKDALSNIKSAADFNSEDYLKVKESMTNLFLSGNESTHGFYVQLYTIQQEDIITTTFCLQEDTGAIYPYDWTFEESDEQSILTTQEGKTYSKKSSSEGSYIFVLNPIVDDEGNSVGLIEVGTNLDNFNKEYNALLWNLLINVAAITVVVVLVLIELLAFLEGREKYREAKKKNQGKNIILSNGILRIIVFIIFFVTNLSTGFLPNYAMTISSNNSGIPKEILAATPISAEVIVGAIFSIWGTYVIKKLGEKKAAILSSFGIVLGFAVRLIPNIWILTLGNAIIGAGWGILLLMVNTMIALKSNEEEKDGGFADYSAAALNGVNCGVVFGGLLTNWFSYKLIFAFSALISFSILIYVRKYFSNEIIKNAEEEQNSEEGKQTVSFARFMLDKRIISYFIMIVIPVIACGYFLNYMFPILGAEYGLSDTNIGYSYLLNGICVICLTNVLTKVFSTKVDKRLSLVISVLLYALAFIIVARYQNIYSIIAALILLGVSDSFGLPIQTGYYTDLDIVKKYGYDKAIGIYSLFENGAQAAGSFIFSWVLIFGVGAGLQIVTGVIIGLALIFFVISLIGNKKANVSVENREE